MIADIFQRYSKAQTIWKVNLILLLSVIVAIGVLPSSANEQASRAAATQAGCGARVSIVLDRSSSIGVDAFSGSAANSARNVAAVKQGAGALVNALRGNDSFTDVHAFATVAQRQNSGGWFNVNTQDAVNWQNMVIAGTTFKRGANAGDQDAYSDGMNAAGEGLTNWEHALQGVENYSNYIGLPSHIVMFTDGEPTTNVPNMQKALAAGGSYSAAGLPNEDGISPEDLSRAFTIADRLRSKGVKILVVGVGGIIKSNLDRLAGGAGNVYIASGFNQLEQKFREAAANICKQGNVILHEGLERLGDGTLRPISIKVDTRAQKNNAASTLVTASGNTTGKADPRWLVSPPNGVEFAGAWDLRATATIPSGYRAVSDTCKLLNEGERVLSQTSTGAADNREAHIININGGSWVGCTFIVEKINQPDSSVAVRVRLKEGSSYSNFAGNVTINVPGSLDNVGVTTLTTGNGYVTRTFNRSTPFNYHLTLGVPAGYRALPEDKCAIGGTAQTDTIPDNNQFRGVNAAVGSAVQCEFVIEKLQAGLHAAGYIPGANGVTGPNGVSYVRDPQNNTFNFDGTNATATPTSTADFTVESGDNGDLVVQNRANDGRSLVGVTCRAGSLTGNIVNVGITPIANGVRLASSALVGGTETYCQFFFAKASLNIVKSVNGQDAPQSNPVVVRVGDTLNYSFSITNNGEIPVRAINLSDSNLTSRRGDALADCTAALNGRTLAVGETFTCNARPITVPVDAGTTYRNVATARGTGVTTDPTYPGPQTPETTDDANIRVTRPVLSIDKSVTPSVLSVDGQSVTYTITVRNTGDASFTGVIEDAAIGYSKTHTVPAASGGNPGVVTITITGKFNATANNILFTKAANPDIAADKTVSLASGSFTNTACIKTINLCDSTTINRANLDITKTASPVSLSVGQNGKYIIRVTNSGNVALVNVRISDDTLKGLFTAANDGVNNNIQTSFALNDPAVSCSISDDVIFSPGETCTVEISYNMTQKLADEIRSRDQIAPIQFVNTAKVVGTPATGTSADEITKTATARITIEANPDWEFEKTTEDTIAYPGDTVTYTFTVRNTGDTPLPSVVVTDETIGKTVTIPGPIAPGASKSVDVDFTIPENFTGTKFHNTAVACIEGEDDDCKEDEEDVYIPKIELDKSGPNVAKAGDTITYTFVVTNRGETPLTDLVITDDTISDLTGEEFEIVIPGTLQPGQSTAPRRVQVTIPSTFTGDVFKNVALVVGVPINPETDDPEPDKPVEDEDDHNVSLIKWRAEKTADREAAAPGDTVEYTITVYNEGTVALTNVEVSDPTIGFPENGESVKVNVPVGGKVEVKATYVIPEDFEGDTFKNVALVCVPRQGQDEDCEEPEDEVDIVRIEVVKKADKTFATVGDEIQYSFDVTNTGNVDLTDVRVVDAKLGFDEVIPSLEIGETVNVVVDEPYVVTAADLEAGQVRNVVIACASVPGQEGDCTPEEPEDPTDDPECPDRPNIVCDDDDNEVPVGDPEIEIVKTADADSADVGDTVTYTFTVSNPSDVTLFDIEVTDNILGDLGTIEELEPGESFQITATFVPTVAGTVVNTATACFERPVDEDNCDNDDHTLVVVTVGGEVVERPRVGGSQLAFTGSPAQNMVKVALWLTLLGSLFVLITKRPRKVRNFN